MIKLTSRELDKLWRVYEKADSEQETDWGTVTANAQMKKMFKWGLETCPHTSGVTRWYKHACDLCWQALEEEIK